MADVLVWVMERRVVLEERAEQLCKELAGTEAEVVSLEAAGRFAAAMLVTAFVAPHIRPGLWRGPGVSGAPLVSGVVLTDTCAPS
ncbi:hypothetical protein ACFRFL_38875 [Streptomyces sp. NPDC056708]|uniref:hypothetical protein n=1 Tax=unclassified Streptomyces TaxID=2593676 RepID=UPI0036AE1CC9